MLLRLDGEAMKIIRTFRPFIAIFRSLNTLHRLNGQSRFVFFPLRLLFYFPSLHAHEAHHGEPQLSHGCTHLPMNCRRVYRFFGKTLIIVIIFFFVNIYGWTFFHSSLRFFFSCFSIFIIIALWIQVVNLLKLLNVNNNKTKAHRHSRKQKKAKNISRRKKRRFFPY